MRSCFRARESTGGVCGMTAVEVRGINKRFPGVIALSDVSIAVEKGEVHALVGENGAGKSTLMKILGGLYSADSGEILIDGHKTDIRSIADAQKTGISVIYQELNLMPALTVAENIFVDDLPGKGGFVNIRELNRKTKQLIQSLSLNIKPTDHVSMLSVSQRQMVEIIKSLSRNASIIIMDEPTAALNNQEVDSLYDIIRKLKADGKTILYISHRLREIFDLSDTISVLRDGQFVGTRKTADITEHELVNLMVGRDVSQMYTYSPSAPGDVMLEVSDFAREGLYEDINFSLRQGEIVGMAGLMGCGREEIVKSVYGLMHRESGALKVDGREVSISRPAHAIKAGIGFVTEDRKDSGIFALMTVRENITINILKHISRFRIISAKQEQRLLAQFTQSMSMKYADETQRILYLSGGNQQKFVLARSLAADCKVLIMIEPTRGIDVGAKAEIYSLLSELAAKGMAILLVSSELPEIMSVCTRTLVIFQGKVTGNILHDEMNESLIMQCATGNETFFSEGAPL